MQATQIPKNSIIVLPVTSTRISVSVQLMLVPVILLLYVLVSQLGLPVYDNDNVQCSKMYKLLLIANRKFRLIPWPVKTKGTQPLFHIYLS